MKHLQGAVERDVRFLQGIPWPSQGHCPAHLESVRILDASQMTDQGIEVGIPDNEFFR